MVKFGIASPAMRNFFLISVYGVCEAGKGSIALERKARRMGWAAAFFRILYWELRMELRNAGTVLVLLPYATTLAVLFYYSMRGEVFQDPRNVIGLLVLALFFMVAMMTTRGLQRERESGAFRVLLMSGIDRSAYLLARVAVKSALVVLLLLFYALIYNVLVVGSSAFLDLTFRALGLLLPCAVNLVLLGEIVAVLAGGNRVREIVLPLLFFPLSLPLFIVYSGVNGVLEGRSDPSGMLMVAFSLLVVYGGAGVLFFQFMATDEA